MEGRSWWATVVRFGCATEPGHSDTAKGRHPTSPCREIFLTIFRLTQPWDVRHRLGADPQVPDRTFSACAGRSPSRRCDGPVESPVSRDQIAADRPFRLCRLCAIAFAGKESCDTTTPNDHSVADAITRSVVDGMSKAIAGEMRSLRAFRHRRCRREDARRDRTGVSASRHCHAAAIKAVRLAVLQPGLGDGEGLVLLL